MSKNKNNRGGKRPHFHCTSELQKRAIRASYARHRSEQQAKHKGEKKQSASDRANEAVSARPAFQLPLRNGGNRWNIFRVPNFILNGKNDNDVHGGLVLDEINNKVLLVEVTHSKKRQGRNTIDIRNLRSDDVDKDGNLRESHLVRRLVVSIETKNGEEAIDVSALKAQLNDLQFTEDEKREILAKLSNLSTAEDRYNRFVELASKKG